MNASEYCSRVGLDLSPSVVEDGLSQLNRALDVAKSASVPSTPNSLARLYEFKVPKLAPDGSCAAYDDFDDKPYDLGAVLGGRTFTSTTRLMTLDTLVSYLEQALCVGWVGVYQARQTENGAALVKLAYRGIPSRAEFPLTPEFAAKSNNATVAMTGTASVINDLPKHLASGGTYYECDPKVKAEACLPVINTKGVIGLIDAEHFVAGWFTPERLGLLVALALELPRLMPAGGVTIS